MYGYSEPVSLSCCIVFNAQEVIDQIVKTRLNRYMSAILIIYNY